MPSMNRRDFLGMTLAGLWLGAGKAWPDATAQCDGRFNVLHIMADDLCSRLGCYGDPIVQTPNIDRLAETGVRFEQAYCQFPLCNPSRASFMTGLRPDTIRVYENRVHFRENAPDAATIPQTFQKAGYSAARVGKIYHYGVPSQIGTSGLDDPASWEKIVNPRGRDVDDIGMVEVLQLGPDGKAMTVTGKGLKDTGGTLSWLAAEGGDDEQTDGKGAAEAARLLEIRANESKPFYLAVGFYRPHTPFIAPKSYFSLYPREKLVVPAIPPNLKDLFPAMALARQKAAEVAMDDSLRRHAIQAYFASTTFMDAQVGHLLDALERTGLADKTIVVFHSDHGYHLGEKNLWQKMSIFEESARVPLIIRVPRNRANGQVCRRPVELVSLHKTLADLCGIAPDSKTEGHSLRPLVENPQAKWKHAAFSQVTRTTETYSAQNRRKPAREIMGRSVRTEQWRYTEWDEGRLGRELYDHAADPAEMKNLADDPKYRKIAAKMRAILHGGGR
ncbi:MAG TPA: sulfatase [Candidatus Hydrogenedentes bacterium]|nr:sulfatase [Candidatus Hydrogenedentota bacterium]HOV75675.1 sulfatase [Candidatus Hydrogenedentota bacterium]